MFSSRNVKMMLSQPALGWGKRQNKNPWDLNCELFPCLLAYQILHNHILNSVIIEVPIHIKKKISYIIFLQVAFLLFFGTPGML